MPWFQLNGGLCFLSTDAYGVFLLYRFADVNTFRRAFPLWGVAVVLEMFVGRILAIH